MKKQLSFLFLLVQFCSYSQCWQNVASGGATVHGIMPNGSLWAWGLNNLGQVGDGSTSNKNFPVRIGESNNWKSVNLLSFHSLALQNDASLYVFGGNNYGQLGDGTTTDRSIPTPIAAGSTWKVASAGVYHSVAVRSDGTLWAWGRNNTGQLGDGTLIDRNVPVQIGSDTDWDFVSAGWDYTLAKKTNGTLWAWGKNDTGALGNGTLTDLTTPTQIGNDSNWSQISAGWGYNVALKSTGTIWIWGGYYEGQFSSNHVPFQIGTDSDWRSITGGDDHHAAIKTNGTLWAAGDNGSGQLGNGTTVDETNLVQIGTRTDWKSVYAAGYQYTVALTNDGELWSWGQNNLGQLGDGTNSGHIIPTMVDCPPLLATTAFSIQTIAISPNPAVSTLYIKNHGTQAIDQITVTDATGKKVLQLQAVSEINVQLLPKGIYFIKVTAGKQVYKNKFLKE